SCTRLWPDMPRCSTPRCSSSIWIRSEASCHCFALFGNSASSFARCTQYSGKQWLRDGSALDVPWPSPQRGELGLTSLFSKGAPNESERDHFKNCFRVSNLCVGGSSWAYRERTSADSSYGNTSRDTRRENRSATSAT